MEQALDDLIQGNYEALRGMKDPEEENKDKD